MTAGEVEAAIIATCLRPECRMAARTLQWIVTQGTRPSAGVYFNDERSLWNLLHIMRQRAVDEGRKQFDTKIGSSRYEQWWQRHGNGLT